MKHYLPSLSGVVALVLLCSSLWAQTPHDQSAHRIPRNTISAIGLINNAGPGGGIWYEHLIGKQNKFSLVFPLSFCYGSVRRSAGRTSNDEGSDLHPRMLVAYPGIRWYPASAANPAPYSLGLHFLLGGGDGAGNTYTNGTNNLTARSMAGILLVQGINFYCGTPRVRAGIELGLGVGSDDGTNSAAGSGVNPLGLAAVQVGWRF